MCDTDTACTSHAQHACMPTTQAQLLMLCRAHGVTTSTEELRGLMEQSLSQGEGSSSRVDYHLFVSRLEQSHGRGRRGGLSLIHI